MSVGPSCQIVRVPRRPLPEAVGRHLIDRQDDIGRALGVEARSVGMAHHECPKVVEPAHGKGKLFEGDGRVGECRLVRAGRCPTADPSPCWGRPARCGRQTDGSVLPPRGCPVRGRRHTGTAGGSSGCCRRRGSAAIHGAGTRPALRCSGLRGSVPRFRAPPGRAPARRRKLRHSGMIRAGLAPTVAISANLTPGASSASASRSTSILSGLRTASTRSPASRPSCRKGQRSPPRSPGRRRR